MSTRPFLVLVLLGIGLAACGHDAEPPVRTLLLTGFGPFGSYDTNPSWEAVRVLEGERIGRTVVRTAQLDVSYESAAGQLARALEATDPDVVLCLGVAPGAAIRVEVVARNADDCIHPDNDGVVRQELPIRPEGPALLPSRLPVRALLSALAGAGYEVQVSEDAGGYLCNHVFYRLADGVTEDRPAGFVHVPELSETWTIDRLREAVRLLVETLDRTAPARDTSN